MGRSGIYERVGKRYWLHLILVSIAIVLCLFMVFLWRVATTIPSERTTFVITGDPVQLVSWDNVRNKLTILTIPADVRIEGAFGAGSLPIASLERLEILDSAKKGIYVQSLSRAFAVPIVGVVHVAGPDKEIVSILSPWNIAHWWDRGLPLSTRFRLWWTLTWLRPDSVTTVDLASRAVLSDTTLPDGSSVRMLDLDTFDVVVGSRLELDTIRREEFRVRVVNTTKILGLGNRTARILSHAGMVVVAVDTDETRQVRCSVRAKKEFIETSTYRYITNVLDCQPEVGEEDGDVDITIRLGSEMELL